MTDDSNSDTNAIPILKTLKEHDFYDHFIRSEVFKKHYKNDAEFEPVKRFLKMGLNRDPVKREKEFWEVLELFLQIGVPSGLREDLCSFYHLGFKKSLCEIL